MVQLVGLHFCGEYQVFWSFGYFHLIFPLLHFYKYIEGEIDQNHAFFENIENLNQMVVSESRTSNDNSLADTIRTTLSGSDISSTAALHRSSFDTDPKSRKPFIYKCSKCKITVFLFSPDDLFVSQHIQNDSAIQENREQSKFKGSHNVQNLDVDATD